MYILTSYLTKKKENYRCVNLKQIVEARHQRHNHHQSRVRVGAAQRRKALHQSTLLRRKKLATKAPTSARIELSLSKRNVKLPPSTDASPAHMYDDTYTYTRKRIGSLNSEGANGSERERNDRKCLGQMALLMSINYWILDFIS